MGDQWFDFPCSYVLRAICEIASCPNGYRNIGGGKCIHYRDYATSWDNQKAYCENDMGGKLVSIRSDRENQIISKFRPSYAAGYHIGFNDKAAEGTYVWSDDSPVVYKNWASGQPDNWYEEDCGMIRGNDEYWNDVGCAANLYGICETWQMCPIGQFATLTYPKSLSNCQKCPAGTYASLVGSRSCTSCPIGTYSSQQGSSSCSSCPSGKYSYANAADCTPCGTGYFQSQGGLQSTCQCIKGYYGDNCNIQCSSSQAWSTTNKRCEQCPSGKYASDYSVSCLSCNTIAGRGYYSSDGTKGSCGCAPGYVGDYCDTVACADYLPGGSLIGLLFHTDRELRDFTKSYDPSTIIHVTKCAYNVAKSS